MAPDSHRELILLLGKQQMAYSAMEALKLRMEDFSPGKK